MHLIKINIKAISRNFLFINEKKVLKNLGLILQGIIIKVRYVMKIKLVLVTCGVI